MTDKEIMEKKVNFKDSSLTEETQVKVYDLTGEHQKALVYVI